MPSTTLNDAPLLNPLREVPTLLRGEAERINGWIRDWNINRAILYLSVIIIGTGLYGAAMGYWRAPYQAFYTGVKFPLVILLTAVGNALINGMLAPLLGLNISFRQSFLAILMSFTIAAAILGAFSPLAFFLVWNTPPLASKANAVSSHNVILLTHVLAIAFAGISANVRLLQFLQQLGGSRRTGLKILLAWLAGNLFLGSQLSWILRPFIGSPNLPVEFLRSEAFQGNFFEAILRAAKHLLSS